MPRKDGWKRASGQRKRSLPMVMTWPSGSSYDFSSAEEAVGCLLHLGVEVEGDVAQLLLDVADDLALGGGGERSSRAR